MLMAGEVFEMRPSRNADGAQLLISAGMESTRFRLAKGCSMYQRPIEMFGWAAVALHLIPRICALHPYDVC